MHKTGAPNTVSEHTSKGVRQHGDTSSGSPSRTPLKRSCSNVSSMSVVSNVSSISGMSSNGMTARQRLRYGYLDSVGV